MKKLIRKGALILAALSVFTTACTQKSAEKTGKSEPASLDVSYSDIVLGSTGTDVSATIKLLTHRTDMLDSTYSGTTWAKYLAEFNKLYPNIKVEIDGITDYAGTALLRLQDASGKWGDIMMIPAVDAKDLPQYFLSFGTVDEMKKQIRFADQWTNGGNTYGIPSTGNAQGVLYNKKVFAQAGITNVPKTPEEFIAALRLIKEKTDAIPLYTNYAAGWTMGAWDAYIGGTATGGTEYINRVLPHEKNPFANRGDGTHAYAVYKVLFDAVSEGLIEDDYTTTDWEGCKGMINRGEIGTMVLGSWAFTQMQGAGPNPDDIGYMSFPITVGGKQYASAGPDYCFGINAKADANQQKASLIFIKWFTEKSGFAYNEGGIPIAASDNNYPPVYAAFDGIEFVPDTPAVAGEEDLMNELNSDSELAINAGGNIKIQEIIEHAYNKDKSFDDIMAEWNEKWSDAQSSNGVSVR